MRILTANLRAGLADPEALAALIAGRDIDVACFQELGPAQAEAVRELMPHGVLEPGSGRTRHHGMGIASREPLEVRKLPLDGRSAFLARLPVEEWPELEGHIELLNVHVMVPVARRSLRAPMRVATERRRQVRQLLEHLDATPEQARLLLGDLNSTPLWPAYRALTSRLTDLHLEHADTAGEKPGATFGFWPGARRWLRLDHALGHGLVAAHIEVVHLEGSDHAGLVVEL